jgi:predicted nucleotidyltransferase component of viral defense system
MPQIWCVATMFDEINIKRFVSELSRITGYSNNLLETDVWQKLVLQNLYSNKEIRDKLVFKGGTCITRTLLGYYRFSEDLDFAWAPPEKSPNFYKLFSHKYLEHLSEIGVTAGKHYGTRGGRLMKWDLSCKERKLIFSVNFSHKLEFTTEYREVGSIQIGLDERKKLSALYPGIFSDYYSKLALPCYSVEEIICEKFAAILTRKGLAKPRDLVDLFYLGTVADLHRILENKKSIGKIRSLIASAPVYTANFQERKGKIAEYVTRLANEALNEREIYITPINHAKLQEFASNSAILPLEKLVEEL